MREKLLRDPVHDLIVFNLDEPLDRLLLQLIDTREFQRLRRIRQIGFAYLAFHGAEHSRFSHSIGVMHLARRMILRLSHGQSLEALTVAAVICAALLHDLGHGPFSHVIEKYFEEPHEAWTRRIILSPKTEVHRALSAYDAQLPAEIVRVLEGAAEPLWVNHLISSQLDADRFDYLMRDSHMTGVKYGVFDLERLLMMLRVSADGTHVVVAAKGLLPVEKYLQSRYQMYRQVYFHKTVTAGEAMLMGLLQRACDLFEMRGNCPGIQKNSPVEHVLCRQQQLSVTDYLALDDSVLYGVMNAWMQCEDQVLRDLSDRLLNRHLFKSIEITNYEEQDMVVAQRIQNAEEVLRNAGFNPDYYLLYSKSADAPYRPYNPRAEGTGGTIWIEDPADPSQSRDIKDASPTIRAFTETPYTIWRAFFPESLRTEIAAALNG